MKKEFNLPSSKQNKPNPIHRKQNKAKQIITKKQNKYPYREVEQPRFLWDDSKLRAERIPLSTSNVNAVHEDLAGRGVVQLLQQAQDGRFATAGRADNGNGSAAFNGERQSLQHFRFGTSWVSETNVLKLNLAFANFDIVASKVCSVKIVLRVHHELVGLRHRRQCFPAVWQERGVLASLKASKQDAEFSSNCIQRIAKTLRPFWFQRRKETGGKKKENVRIYTHNQQPTEDVDVGNAWLRKEVGVCWYAH